jgi:tripartite-type tricarboxylate transporter receptor subunit TctC
LHVSTWTAFFGPKGLDPAVVKKLSKAVMDALADPNLRKRLSDVGQEVYPAEQQTPEYLAAYQAKEIEKWWPIIKKADIDPK